MAKKRANGEGNIRKRKDGRWEGRYTAGHDPETGNAIYKNVLGRTQAEARAKLKAAIEETKSLDVTKAGKYTVGAWMDEWFENYAKIKVRPSSHQTYRGYIDNHIKPNIGKIPLEKLTSLELQKLYKKLLEKGRVDRIESKHQEKGLSAKTVRNIHQIIASAMKLAKEQKIIASDPTQGSTLHKLEHREMKTLPIEQLTSFLREARDSGVFEMYYVELAPGLRRGQEAPANALFLSFRTFRKGSRCRRICLFLRLRRFPLAEDHAPEHQRGSGPLPCGQPLVEENHPHEQRQHGHKIEKGPGARGGHGPDGEIVQQERKHGHADAQIEDGQRGQQGETVRKFDRGKRQQAQEKKKADQRLHGRDQDRRTPGRKLLGAHYIKSAAQHGQYFKKVAENRVRRAFRGFGSSAQPDDPDDGQH